MYDYWLDFFYSSNSVRYLEVGSGLWLWNMDNNT